MKFYIAGLAAAFLLSSITCQEFRYVEQNGDFYIYNYGGTLYPVPSHLHEQFKNNPVAAKQRFIQKVVNTQNRMGIDDRDQVTSIQTFKPNKKQPTAVTFKDPNQNQDFISRGPVNLQQDSNTPFVYPNTFDESQFGNQQVTNQQGFSQVPVGNQQGISQGPVGNQQGFSQRPVGNQQTFNQRPVTSQQNIVQRPVPNQQNYNNQFSRPQSNVQGVSVPQSPNPNPIFNPNTGSNSFYNEQNTNTFRQKLSPNQPDFNPDSESYPPLDTGFNVPIPQRENRDNGNKDITHFAWRLFKGANSQSDYVLSPITPQLLLSYLAWVSDGNTYEELIRANRFGSPENIQRTVDGLLSDGAKREMNIATAFFISQEMKLNQQFFDQSSKRVDIVNVDFKNPENVSRTITRWAKQKTKNGLKINEFNLPQSTKIALTSALYFKANWIFKFNPAQPGMFNTPQGPQLVQMMNMKRKFRWGKIEDFAEWAAIPYESDDSLIIILPNRDQSLDGVINQLNEEAFASVLYAFDRDSSNADVNITLPKFKLESTTNLVEPLKRMGVQELFSPRANLPYLSNYNSVQVSNAQQQSSIDVNEEGTVVITFTTINVVALSFTPPVPSVDFIVDRPFLAVIANRERNIPYVIAKITNPKY